MRGNRIPDAVAIMVLMRFRSVSNAAVRRAATVSGENAPWRVPTWATRAAGAATIRSPIWRSRQERSTSSPTSGPSMRARSSSADAASPG